MAAYLLGFDWALNWSLQPFSIAPVYNVTFGYKTNTVSVGEGEGGGKASESGFGWLQLNQNKEWRILKYGFFEKVGQMQMKQDFHNLW